MSRRGIAATIIAALLLICELPALAADITSLLPRSAPVIEGYTSVDSVASRIASYGPHHIEGLWSIAGESSIIAIERTAPGSDTYRIVAVLPSDRAIMPGTLMGIATASASGELYDAALYTSTTTDRRALAWPKHFTIQLTDSHSRLSFKKVRSRYSLDITRLLPYMVRRVIRQNRGGDGSSTPGCVKIFPLPSNPASPVYL